MPDEENPTKTQTAGWGAFFGNAAVLWLLGGFWFFSAVNPTRTNDFSDYDILLIGALSVFVLCLQTFAAAVLAALRLPAAARFFFAAALTANFYFLSLILTDEIIALSAAALLAVLAACFFGFLVCLQAMNNNRAWKVISLGVAAALCGWAAAVQAAYQADVYYLYAADKKTIVPGGATSSFDIRVVEFKQKPNVYFLSFDGMIPGVLARQYHLTLGGFSFEGLLQKQGFRRFANHFSAGHMTRPGLNLILALDVNYYDNLWGANSAFSPFQGAYAMYSGLVPAPLLEIFKANGYAVRTFAYDRYLGGQQGPHVDEFIRPQGSSACASMKGFRLFNAFFRYCPLLIRAFSQNYFNIRALGVLRQDGLHNPGDVDMLLAVISKTASSKTPAFLFSYLAIPGHTMHSYHADKPETHPAAIRAYLDGVQKTTEALKQIMELIKREDPGAVVYIFGDHGAYFTRGRDLHAIQTDEQFQSYVRDYYGAYGAVYPADVCAESFAAPYSAGYITAPEVARHIVRCLADGEDASGAKTNYPLVLEQAQREEYSARKKIDGGFRDFLYE